MSKSVYIRAHRLRCRTQHHADSLAVEEMKWYCCDRYLVDEEDQGSLPVGPCQIFCRGSASSVAVSTGIPYNLRKQIQARSPRITGGRRENGSQLRADPQLRLKCILTCRHNWELAWVTSRVHSETAYRRYKPQENAPEWDVSLLWKSSRLTRYGGGKWIGMRACCTGWGVAFVAEDGYQKANVNEQLNIGVEEHGNTIGTLDVGSGALVCKGKVVPVSILVERGYHLLQHRTAMVNENDPRTVYVRLLDSEVSAVIARIHSSAVTCSRFPRLNGEDLHFELPEDVRSPGPAGNIDCTTLKQYLQTQGLIFKHDMGLADGSRTWITGVVSAALLAYSTQSTFRVATTLFELDVDRAVEARLTQMLETGLAGIIYTHLLVFLGMICLMCNMFTRLVGVEEVFCVVVESNDGDVAVNAGYEHGCEYVGHNEGAG
ncbi:hypothetical protein POSPLADRAFT_1034108 [Postia placenta MAD-698-R-SB12]|uniref:Uncharacterized protein n=1 Tax=Postia placenta MAD-698-R-SB12 TaxID=670580 RepID=A0A1X6MYK0_9APHY|nr:hypothetical protein POSPLADRAFT_1034108 [Postia placenta MAD-698-R-SB12]OSX61451.1 hypothetical protein POSPLADRAFT_1034108 [Postia placenta MAD-698-R-SB12]